ncbi:unnamed protein product [Zymoseptoria tritici ST99CH_3D7]|uniref:Ecp2 effector protein domain-containing protein n=1 Tax=Zymoseptoria tritici (strain ST99CH_3D7) TaxID=1276538 RepID=A0A1X7S713_ZYMT9|nr:unnamed protein product [Zymoseptoria tritici ST99CH_3D7]
MVAIKNALRLALLSLALSAKARKWTFRINVKRWDNLDCEGYKTLENPKALGTKIKDGDGCQSWPKGKSFYSFTWQWMKYVTGEKFREDISCALLVYELDDCGGHLVWWKDDANTWEDLGDCFAMHGMPGRSMKLTCRKKGVEPDWMDENHWTSPMVYNETVVLPVPE